MREKNEKDEKRDEELKEESTYRYSIFWLISFVLVVLVVLPLISFAVHTINLSKNHLEDASIIRQLSVTQTATPHIRKIISSTEEQIKTLVASFEIYSLDNQVEEKYNDLIEHKILDLVTSKEIPVIGYYDIKGNLLLSSYTRRLGEDSGNFPLFSWEDLQSLQPLIIKYASEAIKSGGKVSSNIFVLRVKMAEENLSDAGKFSLVNVPAKVYALPLKNKGVPIASIVGIALFYEVKNVIKSYAQDFSLLLVDMEGRILVSEGREAFYKEGDNISNDIAFNWAIAKAKSGQIYEMTSTENKKIKKDDGQEVVITASLNPDLGMILYCYSTTKVLFSTVRDIENTSLLWISLSIVAAIFIGIFVTRKITKPIMILTEESKKLAKGDFSAKADVKTRNEVGELARAFNFMASQIQKYIQEVEEMAEENKQLFMSSIAAIVTAIDAKDPYTRGHSARVSGYSVEVAKEYGFDEKGIRIVRIASLLHDVGKIGIEDRILRKPGALTDKEYEIMKSHPVIGAEILGSIPQMKEMIPGIKYHHERWSGGGYPEGLKGSEIPLIARIVGIADAFDAMTTDRPYQKAMTFEMAVNRIKELTPKIYDPMITDVFVKVFEKGRLEKVAKLISVEEKKSIAI